MSEHITDAWITRDELALGHLSLVDPGSFMIRDEPTPTMGRVSKRRRVATSSFVHGGLLVGWTKELVDAGPFIVDVIAATAADVRTKVGELVAALDQFEFEFHVTLDGVPWGWSCLTADYEVGVLSSEHRFGLTVPVRFDFPRQPIPIAGPY